MVIAVSIRKSFWLVPDRSVREYPMRSAASMNIARCGTAPIGCEETRETLTESSAIPAKSSWKSEAMSTATPPRPESD